MVRVLVSSFLMMVVTSEGALAVTCEVPPSGLVSWWNAEDAGDAPGVAVDIIGGNDGVEVGGLEYVAGKVGDRAFSISGFGADYVVVPNDPSLEPASALTVDAWVRASPSDPPGSFGYLVAKGADGCSAGSFGLYTGLLGGVQFYVYDGANFYLSPAADPLMIWDGQWHLVAATYDPAPSDLTVAAGLRLYVDGVQIGEHTGATAEIQYVLSDTRLVIGNYLGCPGPLPFKGEIDEVELFSRALDQSEIQALYAADSNGKCRRKSLST
jgi:hypothetical protein